MFHLSAELEAALLELGDVLLDSAQLRFEPHHLPGVETVQVVLLLLLLLLRVRMPGVAMASGAHPVEVLVQDGYLRLDAVDLDGSVLQALAAQRQQRVDLTEMINRLPLGFYLRSVS